MAQTINVRIPDDIAVRLVYLAEKTNRSKSFYLKDMLEKYIDEYEDAYLALDRLNNKNARYLTTEEVEAELGL
jgi:RHH-type rel operon transcriptional repressor/antitoxin RelB